MRLRTVSAAAVCALTMLLATPSPATATTGDFLYLYGDAEGDTQIGHLADPPSKKCIKLLEVEDEESEQTAHSPRNLTKSTATVFTGFDCQGEYSSIEPGKDGTGELEMRSVVFS